MLAYCGYFVKQRRKTRPNWGMAGTQRSLLQRLIGQAAALLIASYNSSTAFSLVRTFSAPALSIAST